MDRESVALDAQINQLGEEIRHQTESVQQLESEHSERTQRGYAIETETRQNRERLNQIAIESTADRRGGEPTKNAAPN